MNKFYYFSIICSILISCSSNSTRDFSTFESGKNNDLILLSKQLILELQEGQKVHNLIDDLATFSPEKLDSSLINDAQKKAFWINVYNGAVQYLLIQDSTLYDNRSAFFSQKRITVADQELSLDEIEHGLIRTSKLKYSLGYVQNPLASDFEKRYRTEVTDARIHFALNCGAKSCPKIKALDAESINETLDLLSKQFLIESSEYKPQENTIYVSRLFRWFGGDFGGNAGTIEILKRYNILKQNTEPIVKYSDYDWSLSLHAYAKD